MPLQFNNTRAAKEGWGLFNGDEIQRIDEARKFDSDEDAAAFVFRKAHAGSRYHQRAAKLAEPIRWAAETRIKRMSRPALESLVNRLVGILYNDGESRDLNFNKEWSQDEIEAVGEAVDLRLRLRDVHATLRQNQT